MALTYEWKIESISAADNDPISSWSPDAGGLNLANSGGTDRPLYKTNITPTGKPVLRFDGSDDALSTFPAGTVSNVKHVFVVAANRSASGESGALWALDDNTRAVHTAGSSTFDGSSNGTRYRDGIATADFYLNGQFAVYELLVTTPPTALYFNVAAYVGTYFGEWDVCYVGVHDTEVSGSTRTDLIAQLRDTYIQSVPVITTTSLPDGVQNVAYSQALGVTGGTGSITWSVAVGALPDGLTLNSSTGEISGTPTVLGTFNFTVEAEDFAFATDTQALSITIVATPPVIGTDGNPYHKFAIECSVKEYDESIGFSVLKNQLSDGYRRRTLYGSNTGLRGFQLSLPTLTGSSASTKVTGINGEEVTKEEYLWGLYCECEVTGTPFVLESFRNGQYYLVEFVNEKLTYSRFLTKLYSTGIDLTQVRIDGVSVFQPSRMPGLFGYWDANTDFVTNDWDGTDGTGTYTFVKTGDVGDIAAAVNGHQIKRFNNTTNDGSIAATAVGSETFYDVILAMKMRETAFSNDCTIFGNSGFGAYISGDSATTKFTDPGLSSFFYSLNGTEYASNNMQAPMNTWGVCHFRNLSGWDAAAGLAIGGGLGGSDWAEMDLGDVIVLGKPSMQDAREAIEQLITKWL